MNHTTRPPKPTTKGNMKTLEPTKNDMEIALRDYDRQVVTLTAQRDELLAAANNAERELESGVDPKVVAQHLRSVIRERY